jgi:hypothetical protein
VRDRQFPQFSAASILEGSRPGRTTTGHDLNDPEIISSAGTVGTPVAPNESNLLRAIEAARS